MSDPRAPVDPSLLCADLPALGGSIGPELTHFQVDEIPAYVPSGSGAHWYVRVKKRDLTTPRLVDLVAAAAGVRARDVGYAGLKDRHAVTTQWLSVPESAPDPTSWPLGEGLELVEVSRHNNKLRTGHLRGNRFTITLTGVSGDALPGVGAIVDRIEQRGLPNYFGAQRFSRNNLAEALDFIQGKNQRKLSRFLYKLYPSVIQAEAFNRYLKRRQELALDQLLLGDVVRLHGTHSSFVVEDLEREQARFAARDLHPTGPLYGPKMMAPAAVALALENDVQSELGLDAAAWQRLGKAAPGGRRDLLVRPEGLRVTHGDSTLVLEFSLPSGSYATQLVREFTRHPFGQVLAGAS